VVVWKERDFGGAVANVLGGEVCVWAIAIAVSLLLYQNFGRGVTQAEIGRFG